MPVFKNRDLSLATKRAVYRAVVLAVLLYGAETWTMKAVHTRCLNSFHNCCIRTILGVTRYQQWNERLTSQSLSHRFGLQHSISDIILEQRLRWLGHVGRMDEERLPNRLLFGELNMKRPCHGAKKRWRDVLKVDLQAIGVYSFILIYFSTIPSNYYNILTTYTWHCPGYNDMPTGKGEA